MKTYFDVQENTKDKASKNQCWKYLSQMIINYCGVENSKPEEQYKDILINQAQKGKRKTTERKNSRELPWQIINSSILAIK